MFALTLQGGTCMSTAPDVCKTPSPGGPVPVPYPNIFMCNMVLPNTACTKVFISGSPRAQRLKSQTAISNGDEAGNAGGGVVSNKFIGKGEFIKGSAKVTLEGKAAVSQGATTKHTTTETPSASVPSRRRRRWMSRRIAGLAAALVLFILSGGLLLAPAGCEAAKKVPPPPDGALKPSEVVWSQQKDGLSVTVAATDDLNFAYGSPLGITICLYQLSDMSKFTALAATFDGIGKLLGGDIELLGGTALMSRVEYLQPGEKITRSFTLR